MQETYEVGELKVTVQGPATVVERGQPLFSITAADDGDFEQLIDALGGPDEARIYQGGGYWVGFNAGRLCVHVNAPKLQEERPEPPAIRRLRKRQETVAA